MIKHLEIKAREEAQKRFEDENLLKALLLIDSYCDKCTYCHLNFNNERGDGCGYKARKSAIRILSRNK